MLLHLNSGAYSALYFQSISQMYDESHNSSPYFICAPRLLITETSMTAMHISHLTITVIVNGIYRA